MKLIEFHLLGNCRPYYCIIHAIAPILYRYLRRMINATSSQYSQYSNIRSPFKGYHNVRAALHFIGLINLSSFLPLPLHIQFVGIGILADIDLFTPSTRKLLESHFVNLTPNLALHLLNLFFRVKRFRLCVIKH